MKKVDKKDKRQHNKNIEDGVVFEDEIISDTITVKKLREKLEKCVEEKREYLDGWQRSKADFINAKKKEEGLRAELMSFAKEELMFDLLSSIDNFDMAFADKQTWGKVDKDWRKGVEHIHSQLLKTLGEHGLEQFDPSGEQFDPACHDSVEIVVTDKKGDDHKVIEVLQKGYILNKKIVRPAKVKVGQFKN